MDFHSLYGITTAQFLVFQASKVVDNRVLRTLVRRNSTT